jgi:hypothetical protein
MSENPNQPELDLALEHIVDDQEPKEKCREWAAGEILKGRGYEELVTELVGNGWERTEAEEWVEEARKATRQQRGILTREDVAYSSGRRYRRAMRSTLLLGLLSFLAIIGLVFWKYFRH